jgi:hypothetical protein
MRLFYFGLVLLLTHTCGGYIALSYHHRLGYTVANQFWDRNREYYPLNQRKIGVYYIQVGFDGAQMMKAYTAKMTFKNTLTISRLMAISNIERKVGIERLNLITRFTLFNIKFLQQRNCICLNHRNRD